MNAWSKRVESSRHVLNAFGGIEKFSAIQINLNFIDATPQPSVMDASRERSGWMYVHVAILAAVVLQQAVVSKLRLEVDPVFSTYDMYSTTYDSPEAYERASNDQHRFVARMKDGEITDWERLDRVWGLVDDEPAFASFVRDEIRQMRE